ncbi:glycosyltransferase family 4 protein [Paraglaciecola sp.]|uniref:glycosyltransferase family 4 protein n=1 Tax=Paraglaciecola sp. TaxID=1920173 RepID=UPI00273F5980|nr:glycosyltransferase family 4 protein [Paraglaciecola sp.]MDP5032261.1 glycosyltransferase family 4 protein [Paraglaciecola sp.]
MSKALVFSEIFPPMHGGSGRWFWEVYSRLDPKEYVILAGTSADQSEFDEKAILKIKRIKFRYKKWSDWGLLSVSGLLFYMHLFIDTWKVIKQNNISVIHCGRCIPEGFIAYLIKHILNIPYYCYIHGEDVENAATSRAFRWIVKRALRGADLLICNSENSKRVLLAHWDVNPIKIQVITPGVDTSVFAPATRNTALRKHFGWEARPVILTVSRLEARKGHDVLVKALPDIIKAVPNILYAIIGGGPQRSELQSLVAQLKLENHVLFMSELSDQQMVECYQQSDLFILPNRDIGRNIEGFGIVMLEAQACGIPVIGGNSGGTPETLIEGITGFIVDCNVPENLAQKVIAMFATPNDLIEMGLNARKHAENYDWLILSKKLEAVFKGNTCNV